MNFPSHSPSPRATAARIALAFVLFGALWILGSDHLLDLIAGHDRGLAKTLQSLKGLAFVGLSGLLIGVLVLRSERRHEALMAQRQQQTTWLSQILDVSPAVIYALSLQPDGAWRVAFVSGKVKAVTGHTPQHCRADPDWWRRHVHPDDLPRLAATQATLLQQGWVQHEYRFRHADGHDLWINDQLVLVRDESGQPASIIGAWLDVTARRQMEQTLQASEARYRELFDVNPHAMWVYDLDTLRFVAVNAAAVARYGYSAEEFGAMTLADIRPPQERTRLSEALAALQQQPGQYSESGEWQHQRKDGSTFWVAISGHSMVRDGRRLRLVLAQDVTDRRQAEAHARLIARVFEASQQAICITDRDNRVVSVNRAFTQITGYSLDEMRGQTPALLQSGRHDRHFYQAMWAQILTEGRWEGEIWNRRKSGDIYPEWLTISTVTGDNGQVLQYLGIFTETSSRKEAEARIQRLAHHDALTGLPNRALLADRAQLALAAAQRQNDRVVLMHLNIDHFAAINESLGHEAGDTVLCEVARRLEAGLGPDDTASRQGADDYVLLLPHSGAQEAAALSLRLSAAVAEPMTVAGQRLSVGLSIGVAEYPDNGTTLAALSQAAESAVHQAKRAGRNTVRFYSPQAQEQNRDALLLGQALRGAAARGELVLHYQPQWCIRTRRLTGLEALVRWQHPEWGQVPPGRFIPVAERTGLIREIDPWVLQEALRQQAAWQAAGLSVVPVAVNLSALQFRSPGLRDTLQAALQRSRLPAHLLELELTESVAMENSEFTVATIAELKQLGLQLAIDDFGTGYSSLGYLKRFAVDKLKIDQSFVRGLTLDRQDEAIVTAIITLARNLGLRTLAEGVETQAQFDFLHQHGCDEVQGWLLGRAVPAEQARGWLG